MKTRASSGMEDRRVFGADQPPTAASVTECRSLVKPVASRSGGFMTLIGRCSNSLRFGIEPDALNDDRCGRALEALAEQADAVVGSIAAAAIAVFGLDVSRFSWDLTSMSVSGAYNGADPDYERPAIGSLQTAGGGPGGPAVGGPGPPNQTADGDERGGQVQVEVDDRRVLLGAAA